MNTFIGESVEFLYKKYGEKISELNILLPSRRAQLFFNIELSKLSQPRAVWQPNYLSIDSLTQEITSLDVANKIKLLCELHKSYSKFKDESFESFYWWGSMLLADFDTIDNYLIDAKKLFLNVKELGDIDILYGDVAQQQREFIENFWRSINLSNKHSEEQIKFLKVWEILYDVYIDFKTSLSNQNIGYKGMIYRRAIEMLDGVALDYFAGKSFAIIGFNALSGCEKMLFSAISRYAQCDFLWDYDNYYTAQNPKHDAGLFIRENIALLGESNNSNKNNYTKPKNITVVDTPTDSLMCKYVWEFLSKAHDKAQNEGRELGRETAIVLVDESLLIPVLHSIPSAIKRFNITAGYPLTSTPVYSLFEYIVRLHSNRRIAEQMDQIYIPDVEKVLSHPLVLQASQSEHIDNLKNWREQLPQTSSWVDASEINAISPLEGLLPRKGEHIAQYLTRAINTIGVNYSQSDEIQKTTIEFLAAANEAIIQTSNLLSETSSDERVFIAALRKNLSSCQVTFKGEPLIGIQIMGILETRNLDFENLLILSLNDDNYPGSLIRSSFVPSSLRVGFGLPDRSHQEAMYCYYFYRLLQRSKNIDIAYCSSTEGMRNGELSRYVSQIHYKKEHVINYRSLSVSTHTNAASSELKRGQEYDALISDLLKAKRTISPTMLYEWIKCKKSFYYKYALKIRATHKISSDIGVADFGTAIHEVLNTIYSKVIGLDNKQTREILRSSLGNIEQLCQDYFNAILDSQSDNSSIASTLRFTNSYIRNVIEWDLRRVDDFSILALEKEIFGTIYVSTNYGDFNAKLYGVVDRIERSGNCIDIISDYKSGTICNTTNNIAGLFMPQRSPNKAFMQSLYYCYIYQKGQNRRVAPSLLFVKYMGDKNYQPKLILKDRSKSYIIDDFSEHFDEFEEALSSTIKEIVEYNQTFIEETDIEENCKYCDFKNLCLK